MLISDHDYNTVHLYDVILNYAYCIYFKIEFSSDSFSNVIRVNSFKQPFSHAIVCTPLIMIKLIVINIITYRWQDNLMTNFNGHLVSSFVFAYQRFNVFFAISGIEFWNRDSHDIINWWHGYLVTKLDGQEDIRLQVSCFVCANRNLIMFFLQFQVPLWHWNNGFGTVQSHNGIKWFHCCLLL